MGGGVGTSSLSPLDTWLVEWVSAEAKTLDDAVMRLNLANAGTLKHWAMHFIGSRATTEFGIRRQRQILRIARIDRARVEVAYCGEGESPRGEMMSLWAFATDYAVVTEPPAPHLVRPIDFSWLDHLLQRGPATARLWSMKRQRVESVTFDALFGD